MEDGRGNFVRRVSDQPLLSIDNWSVNTIIPGVDPKFYYRCVYGGSADLGSNAAGNKDDEKMVTPP
jgi:hypothetical protein